MKTKINFILNGEGQKMFSKKIYSIITDLDHIPEFDEVKEIIDKEKIPGKFINGFNIFHGDFIDLEVGDCVKIIDPENNPEEPLEYLTIVTNISDESIYVESENEVFFDFSGKGHGKGKFSPKLKIPTSLETKEYLEERRRTMMSEIVSDFFENYYNLLALKTEAIEKIYQIIMNPNSKDPNSPYNDEN